MVRHLRLDDCSSLLKLLADDVRLGAVRLLLEGPQRVGELNDVLRVDPSLLSHHLRVLREGGIVVARRDGKAVLYQLARGLGSRRSGRALDLGCCRLVFG